jgi:hypothetical protein
MLAPSLAQSVHGGTVGSEREKEKEKRGESWQILSASCIRVKQRRTLQETVVTESVCTYWELLSEHGLMRENRTLWPTHNAQARFTAALSRKLTVQGVLQAIKSQAYS